MLRKVLVFMAQSALILLVLGFGLCLCGLLTGSCAALPSLAWLSGMAWLLARLAPAALGVPRRARISRARLRRAVPHRTPPTLRVSRAA